MNSVTNSESNGCFGPDLTTGLQSAFAEASAATQLNRSGLEEIELIVVWRR
jgi:hypothetical protein